MTKNSTQSKILTIRVPDSGTLQEVQQLARKLVKDEWIKAHPDIKPNKGGRPNFRDRIFSACEKIITTFEDDRFLKDYSQEELISRVMLQPGLNNIHKKTVERHVKDWFKQLPFHYWPQAKLEQNPKVLEWSAVFPIRLKIHRELYLPWLSKNIPKGKTFNELVRLEESGKLVPPPSLKRKMNEEFTRQLKDTLAQNPSLEKRLRRYDLLP